MGRSDRPLEILCLAGDGIGPEITASTKAVVEAAAHSNETAIVLRDA